MNAQEIRKREQEIVGDYPDHPDDMTALQVSYWFGSKQSFWSDAVARKLATQEEYEAARRFYGNMFHYRGD